MKGLSHAGRILFALPFLVFGAFHFLNGSAMTGIVPAFLPLKIVWVYLVGAALVGAGLSILLQRRVRVVAALLGLMLLGFVVLVHVPALGNPALRQMETMNLLKDTALAGAAFFIAGQAGRR